MEAKHTPGPQALSMSAREISSVLELIGGNPVGIQRGWLKNKQTMMERVGGDMADLLAAAEAYLYGRPVDRQGMEANRAALAAAIAAARGEGENSE